MFTEPLTLEGQYVRLEPLAMNHHAGLCEATLDNEVWRWLPEPIATPDEMHTFIEQALTLGSSLPFATIYKPENRVVGTTRYVNINEANRRLEIGATIIGKAWQRTIVNTEAKYLMLRHAFEKLGCIRVEFKTDVLNTKSHTAILRLGATQEGISRKQRICADGRIRDSVFFSILDEEWPAVKANLEAKLT